MQWIRPIFAHVHQFLLNSIKLAFLIEVSSEHIDVINDLNIRFRLGEENSCTANKRFTVQIVGWDKGQNDRYQILFAPIIRNGSFQFFHK